MREVGAALVGPIYRPAMSVPAARYFLARRAHPWREHVPIPLSWFATVRACPRVQLRELGLIHGGTVVLFTAACQWRYSAGEGRGERWSGKKGRGHELGRGVATGRPSTGGGGRREGRMGCCCCCGPRGEMSSYFYSLFLFPGFPILSFECI